MSNEHVFLTLKEISKRYPSGERLVNEVPEVLHNVHLDLSEGESIAIVGPSGSGKSTLLNLISTVDKPTSGQILFCGENIAKYGEKELSIYRNQKIGVIFQDHHLLPQCTVLENVLLPTLVPTNPLSSVDADERAKGLLNRVALEHRYHHLPAQLSGGERQRVAVVRALINRPRLVLADEPSGALDENTADKLITLLIDLNREEKVSLIMVTHALKLAIKMERLFELKEGQLVLKSKCSLDR